MDLVPFILAERQVLKLLLLLFFGSSGLGATLCTDYRQIWQGGGGPNILLTAKVENFWGSFGEYRPGKPQKLRNNLEMARTNFYRPMSTNPLVENFETYDFDATL